MKVRVSSPFLTELVRGALLLGKFDLDMEWKGWEIEVDREVVRNALERAASLAGEDKLMRIGNDKKPLAAMLSNCLGVNKEVEGLKEFLELAVQNLDKLEGCGEAEASKLAISKAEYYENTKTPMMLGSNEPVGDALTIALGYAGTVWNLGNVRYPGGDIASFFLVPVTLNADATGFLSQRLSRGKEKGKKLLPSYVTYEWALTLWMALKFDVKGVFRVLFVERGNKVYVRPSVTVDLSAEREALASVFGGDLGKVESALDYVLNNVLSDQPDALAVRFVSALYQVAHHAMPPVELKAFGLREYASALSTESSQVDFVVRQVGRVAQLVKV